MPRRQWLALASVGLILALAFVASFLALVRYPTYQGRPLSFWLKGFDSNASAERQEEASRALRSMGPAVYPVLAGMLDARDSRFREALTAVAGIVPGLRSKVSGAQDYRNRARRALMALGEESVPAITALLTDPKSELRPQAILMLGELGVKSAGAVPALVSVMRDPDLGDGAVRALGNIGAPAAGEAPRIVDWLRAVEPARASAAFFALRAMKPHSRSVVPALVAVANDESVSSVARAVAVASARELASGEPDLENLSAEALMLYQSMDWQRRGGRQRRRAGP